MTESEVWKDVVGYEGLYKVSDKGRVYSVERISSQGKECGGLTLKLRHDKDGYSQISLCKNGKSKTKKVHRLVAGAFLPNPNGLPQVNHRDEVKDNNNVENLEWCDSKYNNNHGTRNERVTQARSKKVKATNIKTNEVVKFNSTHDAGRKGYDQSSVAKACKGVFYTSGHAYRGYIWHYYEEVEGNESK